MCRLGQVFLRNTSRYKPLLSFTDSLPRSRFPEVYHQYGTPNMNRLIWLVCGIALLMNPHTLVAQRRGGRGAGTARAPAGVSTPDDLKDFKRAVALQGTPG